MAERDATREVPAVDGAHDGGRPARASPDVRPVNIGDVDRRAIIGYIVRGWEAEAAGSHAASNGRVDWGGGFQHSPFVS